MLSPFVSKPAVQILLGFLVCILATAGGSQAQDVTVSVQDVGATPGEPVTVPIEVSGFNDIGALDFTIDFDSGALSFPEDPETSDLIKDPPRDDFTANVTEPGRLVISWFDATSPIDLGDGTLLSLTFSNFAGGEGQVAFDSSSEIADSEANEIPADFQDGIVEEAEGAKLLTNEVLYDVPSSSGDANGDGRVDAEEDQFVEVFNPGSDPVDLAGATLENSAGEQHAFPGGTTLGAGEAAVVFGGGDPAGAIPGVVQVASTGGLGLETDGDEVVLRDAEGKQLDRVSYSGNVTGESITRDPQFEGGFVPHTALDSDRRFSPGRAAGGDPLPVELAEFVGRQVGESSVRLRWKTSSETNNAGFEVQHQGPSTEEWAELGFVESKAEGGTATTQSLTYAFTAGDVAAGTHRFRLRQVDLDGSSTRTDPVVVDVQMEEAVRLSAPSPNPVRSGASLRFSVKEPAETTVRLYNALGQQVATVYEGRPAAGESQRVRVRTAELSSGMYLIRLQAGQHAQTRRLTVVK